jgi:membrane protein
VAKKRSKRAPVGDLMGGVVALLAIGAAMFRRPSRPDGPERPSPPPAEQSAKPAPHVDSAERPGGLKGKLYDAGQRFRPLCVALKMNDRFSEVHGNFLAGAITLQSFLSLFPLLLVTLAVLGFVTAHQNPDLAVEVIAKLGLQGESAKVFSDAVQAATEARRTSLGIGTVGLLWSGLGLVGSLQYAYNQVWQVEARGMKDKLVGVAWLLGAAVLFLASAAATAVLGLLPGFLWPVSIVLTLVVNIVLWLWTARLLPNRDIGWRPLLPGAVLGGVGLEILKVVGRFYVPHAISSASAVYGSIGVVFAVLAWLFFFGRLIVYSACLNVVLWEEREGVVTSVIEVPRTPEATAEAKRSGQSDPAAEPVPA